MDLFRLKVFLTAVQKELAARQLRCVDIEGLSFDREFAFVELQGEHNALVE